LTIPFFKNIPSFFRFFLFFFEPRFSFIFFYGIFIFFNFDFDFAGKAQALDQELIDRIRESVLSILNSQDEVIATAIVWDYTPNEVLLLTNYHTWDSEEFKYCFPPNKKSKKSKKKAEDEEEDDKDDVENEELGLQNKGEFDQKFVLTADLFYKWDKETDFAVLKLPKEGFTMRRMPIHQRVVETMKIYAFGYVGHSKQFNITGGEVSGFIADGFTMNLLFAPGYSGAAILADYLGRAIGYMGGNWDASKEKNSQHQSYAYRFDRVIRATDRQDSPTNSPSARRNKT
jgi:hypothetical protein